MPKLSYLVNALDYQLPSLVRELNEVAELPGSLVHAGSATIRSYVHSVIKEQKIVATHYQHVDGTSFAAPIVTSIVAQILQANPKLSPTAVKDILISSSERLVGKPLLRQGYGVVNAKRSVELALREIHSGEISLVKRTGSRVLFTYHNDVADTVSLVGDFNQWNSQVNPFAKIVSGLWEVEISDLSAGTYQYKFLVNGNEWIEDPSNGQKTADNFGGLNSVLLIGKEGVE